MLVRRRLWYLFPTYVYLRFRIFPFTKMQISHIWKIFINYPDGAVINLLSMQRSHNYELFTYIMHKKKDAIHLASNQVE